MLLLEVEDEGLDVEIRNMGEAGKKWGGEGTPRA